MSRFGIRLKFLLVILLSTCLTLLCTALFRSGWGVAAFFGGLAVLAAVMDYALTPGAKWFSVERELPAFEQNREMQIVLTVKSKGSGNLRMRLTDTPPDTFQGGRDVVALLLESGKVQYSYSVIPARRGVFSFGHVYLEVWGRWGFSVRRFSLKCPNDVAVYPNLAPMRHYRMLAERRQLFREDSAIHKVRGIGSEFAGIREYAPDDDWSRVNWKATARVGKLMTNLYDAEKNREVVLAVDTGRWMQASTDGVTRLDRALEMTAALMQVALSSGDRVGLVLYDAGVSLYLPPDKGTAHATKILQALYEAKPKNSPSSFSALSALLRHKLTKRAFICVFTYMDNPQEAGLAVKEMAPIRRRHSIYVGSIADEGLEALITKKAAEPGDMYLKAAATHRKLSVLEAVDVCKRNGIGSYAAEPGELLTRSVRHYLQVKGRPM